MEEKYQSLPEALRVNPYTVPDGYFTDLQRNTLAQCRLIEASAHAPDLPLGYFDQLSNEILIKIKEQQLKETITESGFSIPDGYFKHLELQLSLQQKLIDQGMSSGFTIPETYFERQEEEIARQTYRKHDTPIRKIRHPKWIAYAAAACIALAIGVFGLTQLTMDNHTTASNHLASVSDQEIFNYLELYGSDHDITYISEQLNDFDEPIIGEGISEEDIEAYLNHTL